MDFSELTPEEMPFEYKGKRYVLIEPDGEATVAYRNAVLGSTELRDGKPIRMVGLAEAEPILVQKCVYEVIVDDKTKVETRGRVTMVWVKALPYRVLKKLFEEAKRMGELDDKSEKAKNELSGSTDTSD